MGSTNYYTYSEPSWEDTGVLTNSTVDNYEVAVAKASDGKVTLTLNGISVNKYYCWFEGSWPHHCGIYALGDVTLVLQNDNEVSGPNLYTTSQGIQCNGKLTISGDGSGTFKSKVINSNDTSSSSRGISADEVVIKSGEVNAIGESANYSYGINSKNGITIQGGKVTAKSKANGSTHKAFNVQPTINYSGGYRWRVGETGSLQSYILSSAAAYTLTSGNEYVEIRSIPDSWLKYNSGQYIYADFSWISSAGTEDEPYNIVDAADLAGLAALVKYNSSSSVELTDGDGYKAWTSKFSGKFFELTDDIDISA